MCALKKNFSSVNISSLKAKLASYLKEVKSGKSYLVIQRNTPVAKVIPVNVETGGINIRNPLTPLRKALSQLEKSDIKLPNLDSLSLLLEDRNKR